MDFKKIADKITLPVAIVVSAIVFAASYYAVQYNKQHSIERQQQIEIEQARQKQSEKALKEAQAKKESERALETCIASAIDNHSFTWYKECKTRGEFTSKCDNIQKLNFSDYLDKYGLTLENYNQQRGLSYSDNIADDFVTGGSDYYRRRGEECSCRLPFTVGDRFNEQLERDKNECFQRYK